MFYDVSMAEGITITGQFVIQWIAEHMNKYLNELFGTVGKDYVLASDTDSLYITLDPLVNQVMPGETDHKKITKFLEKACEGPISSFIDKTYRELAKYMNAREHVMQMKLECIADRGIWRGKKMYVLNVLYQEGVFYDEPVIKVTGLESVRSSTPQVCRDKIKAALKIILTQDEEILHDFISDFRKEFMDLDWEQVAFPRGMSDIGKWEDASLGHKSGTPIHVKGAIAYNTLIRKHHLETKYPFIYDGDKVKFAYLKKYNPYNIPVISTPGEMPKEFGLEVFIDRDLQFEKTFIGPIESITNVVGWSTEKRASLDSFFG